MVGDDVIQFLGQLGLQHVQFFCKEGRSMLERIVEAMSGIEKFESIIGMGTTGHNLVEFMFALVVEFITFERYTLTSES